MQLDQVDSAWLAFLAGVITSPHCVAMCGPLACAVLGKRQGDSELVTALSPIAYHSGRVISYSIIGTLIGWLSFELVGFFQLPLVRFFPWVLVVLLIGFAFGADKWLPKPRWAAKVTSRLWAPVMRLPRLASSAALGLVTPAFPCGPLYMIFWAALLSGSAFTGLQISLGFALGTIPLMWIAQTQYGKLDGLLGPIRIKWAQRIVALAAGCLLAMRLYQASDTVLASDFCCPNFF